MALVTPANPSDPFDDDLFRRRLAEAKARVAPVLPDLDPGDLDLILRSLLRPFGTASGSSCGSCVLASSSFDEACSSTGSALMLALPGTPPRRSRAGRR